MRNVVTIAGSGLFRDSRTAVPATALLVLAVLLTAVWAGALLQRAAGPGYAFVAFSFAAAVVALLAPFWAALAAIGLLVAAADFIALAPGTFLSFGTPRGGFALAGLAIAWTVLAAALHQLQRRVEGEREARERSGRAAAQSGRVAQLTAALGLARSPDAVADTTVHEALHGLQGDAAMLLLVHDDESVAAVTRAVGYSREVSTEAAPVHALPGPVRDTIRRAAPVILESPAERAVEYGSGAEGEDEGSAAVAAVPLVSAGRVRAVVRLDFREPRSFTEDDHAYLEALAAHAAHALDRTCEQESDQRARIEAEDLRRRADEELARRQTIEQKLRASETRYRALATRTTRLHELTAALSEAVTTRAVAAAIVQHATIVVGAAAGAVCLLVEDGAAFDTLSSAPDAPPSRVPVEAGLCEAEVVGTRQPLFIRSWEESQERFWRSASAAADGAYVSSTALPLLVDGMPAGVLRFDFSVPVNFDEEYQALLVSVAQHCSQALDRARLYESAQRARAEAEAASRLKDDFLSIVSHELRTPLNAVLGWASMLQKTSVDAPLAQRAVRSIHENATRQAQLIDDLLDISRIAAGRATLDIQVLELSTLVAGVVESLTPMAVANGVELALGAFPPAVVSGDRRRLEQVFFNLLGNALKFTPSGGWIRLEAATVDGAVRIRVTDSGIGIDPQFLPHVFERFRQADSTSTRSYGGLGLGLAIAKQLVEAHKGAILVESAGSGRGAAFTVQLPLSAEAADRHPARAPASRTEQVQAPRLEGTRVLVVDDEPDAREIMSCALRESGATVRAAGTAAEAFDLLMSGGFDVLVADVAMPGEDGCSLVRRVRACGEPAVAPIPAAAVTAHAQEDERRDVLAAGFSVHIAKPIEPEALARAVHDLARDRPGITLAAS